MSILLHMVANTLHLGGDRLRIDNATITDDAYTDRYFNTTADVKSTIRFQSDGTVDYLRTANSNSTDVYNWVLPVENAGNYHVRGTVTDSPTSASITLPSGWRALTSSVTYGIFKNSVGSFNYDDSCTMLLELSDDGGSTTLESASVTFRLQVEKVI